MVQNSALYLRLLTPDDVGAHYLRWMHNPAIVQYLESRWSVHTIDSIKKYVAETNASGNNFLFGMFLLESHQHIGNIKIGNVNWIHRFADVGLMIGEETAWGKGYGTEAIRLVAQYAFEEINLHKLVAGIYTSNVGSYRAFIKAGWREVGLLAKHRLLHGVYVDEWLMECIAL